jgi:two-component system response regulator (stage 0 sporulation protein A)
MEKKIIEILKDLGIPMGNKGIKYIKDAVKTVAEGEAILYNMTLHGGLYETIAVLNNTESTRVERAMRHAIECCFKNCDKEILRGYFGNVTGKLTNRNFIAALACEVRLNK